MSTCELTTLYQLCRLGIPGPVLASTLFEDLRATIPCDAMTLLWQPATSSVARWFYESDSELNCGVVNEQSFNVMFAAVPLSEGLALLETNSLFNQKIAAALSIRSHIVAQSTENLVLYLTRGDRRLGAMLLHRLDKDPFSVTEKASLARWAATLSSALDIDTHQCPFVTSEAVAGIVLLDSNMNIQSASCRGRKWIHLCEAPDCGRNSSNRGSSLSEMLRARFGSADEPSAANFVLSNSWGSFQFRLHCLVDSSIHSDSLTAVTVHRQEPLPLSVLRRAQALALTEKQTDICLLLIDGLSYSTIAKKLCISPTTVVDHIRKVYEKVGVSSRSELIAMLLLEEQGNARRERSCAPLQRNSRVSMSSIKGA